MNTHLHPDAPIVAPIPYGALVLSAIALIGATIASVSTLAWSGAFPPAPPYPLFNAVLAEARGWSAVTLALVPLTALAIAFAAHGSLRARLAWAGTMAYLVYTYLEFAVSGPFTALYLVYVATLACAVPALILAVASVNVADLPGAIDDAPRRLIIGYALTIAVGLAAAWLKDVAVRSLEGDFGWPAPVASIRQAVQALDLGLQVPLALATAILLLRRRPSGYLLAGIFLTSSICMSVALTAMVIVSATGKDEGAAVAIPFALLAGVTIVPCVAFFRSVCAAPRARERLPGALGGAPR